MTDAKIFPKEEELQEIFALFSSPTDDELHQVYDPENPNFYKGEDLKQEYSLMQEKREFAEDAWRSVIFFLHKHGFVMTRSGIQYDLITSSGYSKDVSS
jgi:hypothetical protein